MLMAFPDARLKHERRLHPELNRLSAIPQPNPVTQSQHSKTTSVDDNSYSYTDAAGMYRETEPAWRRSASLLPVPAAHPGQPVLPAHPAQTVQTVQPAQIVQPAQPVHLTNRRIYHHTDETRRQYLGVDLDRISPHPQTSTFEDLDDSSMKRKSSTEDDIIEIPVRVTATPRGILRKPTEKFPDEHDFIRPGVTPQKASLKSTGDLANARWTKIDRRLVNPQALEEAKERFEERMDFVIVLRVLTKEEIQKLADRTLEIRQQRENSEREGHLKSKPRDEDQTVEPTRGRLLTQRPTLNRPTSLEPAFPSEGPRRIRSSARGHSSPAVSPQFLPVEDQPEDSIDDISLDSRAPIPSLERINVTTQSCARCLKVGEPCSGDPGDESGCDECKLLRIVERCTFGPKRDISRHSNESGQPLSKEDIE
jgi:hypothetical protein